MLRRVECLPLLDLVESLELRHGDKDDNGLLAALDLDLLGARDLEGSELGLELRDVGLKVNESLSDNGLDLRGGAGGRVGRAEDFLLDGSHVDYMRDGVCQGDEKRETKVSCAGSVGASSGRIVIASSWVISASFGP